MPPSPPIGLQLARAARAVSAEFDRVLAEAGGSVSTWQVLLLIRSGQFGQQSEMAKAMGITGATLTHHLNALERQGLVRRWREDTNRRVQRVELTEAGVDVFEGLRSVAQAHDRRLRAKLSKDELAQLATLLEKISS